MILDIEAIFSHWGGGGQDEIWMLVRSMKIWGRNILDTWSRRLGKSEGKMKDEQVLNNAGDKVVRNFDLRVVHLEALKEWSRDFMGNHWAAWHDRVLETVEEMRQSKGGMPGSREEKDEKPLVLMEWKGNECAEMVGWAVRGWRKSKWTD